MGLCFGVWVAYAALGKKIINPALSSEDSELVSLFVGIRWCFFSYFV